MLQIAFGKNVNIWILVEWDRLVTPMAFQFCLYAVYNECHYSCYRMNRGNVRIHLQSFIQRRGHKTGLGRQQQQV